MAGKYTPPIALSQSQIMLLSTDFRIELARTGRYDREAEEELGNLFEKVLSDSTT